MTVLTRALDARPDYRYQTALEMKKDLLEIHDTTVESNLQLRQNVQLKERAEAAVQSRRGSRRHGPLWFRLALGLLLGVSVAVLLFVLQSTR